MNNVEEYQSLVIVLKQALEFYADKKNYVINVPQNNILFAYIEMDKGEQARFALERIEKMEKQSKELEEKFVKEVTNAIKNNEEIGDVLNIIEDYKNISGIQYTEEEQEHLNRMKENLKNSSLNENNNIR